MPAVELRGIQKSFGKTQILQGIDLSISDGEFVVLVGPSGCGKSTLLRILSGLETPSQGQILFDGRDVTSSAPKDRDIGMVFQSYALYPHLTVGQNIAFGLELRGMAKSKTAERVAEVAEMLGLTSLVDRLPKALSGGQRQRVAMGRAIARRPSIYLFDEPLSNLDAALRLKMRMEIKRLHQTLGKTIVYVTHDQVEAMTLADRIVVLNGGKVEQVGEPIEVYDSPETTFVAQFLGSPPMNLLPSDRPGVVSEGVRPEDFVVDADGPYVLELDFLEPIGCETFAHGSLKTTGADTRVVVRLEARGHRIGEKLHLSARRKLFFGPDGKRVSGESC